MGIFVGGEGMRHTDIVACMIDYEHVFLYSELYGRNDLSTRRGKYATSYCCRHWFSLM